MKRSDINALIRSATKCFESHGWTLPPHPRWDVTDFGLGCHRRYGLVLVNLAEEPEYCEKLMYAQREMTTPAHTHAKKKEDIICRWGELKIVLWKNKEQTASDVVSVKINGQTTGVRAGQPVLLQPGERITLTPGVWHEFAPASEECIIGEVSTANDDLNDNFFVSPDIGRFPGVEENEPPLVKLVSDK
jgi:D-lyxose ketol-isomerase